MNSEENQAIHIECPSCSRQNKIENSEGALCGECKKELSGYFFAARIKKPLLSTTAALLVGGVVAYQIDNRFIEEQRYPVQTEYALIDSCVNASGNLVRASVLRVKKERCTCALEKTMAQFSYSKYKKSSTEFRSSFGSNLRACS